MCGRKLGNRGGLALGGLIGAISARDRRMNN